MIKKTPIWTWVVPDREKGEISSWKERGGKWLVYGSRIEMELLGRLLEKYVNRGSVVSAKFWNASEKSALCVYSLDSDREKTKEILYYLGYTPTAWEYDYARIKNWTRPRFFISAFHKLSIMLNAFGIIGTIRFIIRAYS